MAVTPINLSRVTLNLRTSQLLSSLRQNTASIFQSQTRLATGRNYLTISDNPVAASKSIRFTESVTRQEQILKNLRYADLVLGTSDSALTDVNDLLSQAESIASGSIGPQSDGRERESNAIVIASIRDQLTTIGNKQLNGSYIFGGRVTDRPPFVSASGGVAYVGDTGDVLARVSRFEEEPINVTGNILFGALTTTIGPTADLTPSLTPQTRLEDLAGANLQGIRKGTFVIETSDGQTLQVDLTNADTVGDVVDRINTTASDAGMTLSVAIESSGLSVTTGGAEIKDTNGGKIASDLGILRSTANPAPTRAISIIPRITSSTPLTALNAGEGLPEGETFRIEYGGNVAIIDLSEAVTVEDAINQINAADINVHANISPDGKGIQIVGQVSGTRLAVGENGGTLAAALGLRSFREETQLSTLNFGKGVEILEGEPDLRITAKDGQTFDVNLDGANTVGDILTLINTAAETAGISVKASLATVGNGFLITDDTGGDGLLNIGRADTRSFAVDDLGLLTASTGEEITAQGKDVSTVRAEGVLNALVELENALISNDERAVTEVANRLQDMSRELTRTNGKIGARARTVQDRVIQTENAVLATQTFLSDIEEVDYTVAVTEFQQAQTALQAGLLSGSQILNLSLLDFLR